MLTVAIVDDEADLRGLVRTLLADEPAIKVVGEGGNAEEAIDLAMNKCPDVMILDRMMPGQDGLAAIPRIRELSPNTKILMFTAAPERSLFDSTTLAAPDRLMGKTESVLALVPAIMELGAMEGTSL
ncbi:MAG: response regulator transcription factor [Actinomycetota bacterium]